eukprot:CAMPEP_0173140414 /NCGR_PEP_ID=MMETSP1105-20130129/4875_1 /TAXON_ID=2985 /ORGANISM="Ochromonas sp., Strain BG-1" /LENGTH=362 /DNA_ID=CAMNT_0014053403 /DNA_START=1887 /DNA_END=2972 /DNA_ORIENTATION=+
MARLERPADSQTPSIHVDDYILDHTFSVKYTAKGTEIKLKDRTEFYAAGSSRSSYGLIIIPDALGWNAGRIRNICDIFGEKDIFSIVPNFHSRGVEGHTQGFFESENLMDYHKSRILDGNVKPIVADLVAFLKQEKIEKIALLGFAWGSWVVASLLASEMADEFYCGALMQPSLNLEEQRYGGSTADLISRINRPVLLMPIMLDPKAYTSYVKLLRYKLPTSTVVDYHNMESGFMLHGFIEDERVRRACHKAIDQIYNYFQLHFQMNLEDFLVEEVDDLGPEAEIKRTRWGQKMKEGGAKLKDFMDRTGQKIKESFQHLGDSMRMKRSHDEEEVRPNEVETAQATRTKNTSYTSEYVVDRYP